MKSEDKLAMGRRMQLQIQRQNKIAVKIQPLLDRGIHPVQAMVMAGDLVSADEADEAVAKGLSPMKALWQVGSYCRLEWAVARLPEDQLLPLLPGLWAFSDPDDSLPQYLALWRKAYTRNGKTVTDFEKGDPQVIPEGLLYRGQIGPDVGISWTANREVAEKFAKTGGGRVQVRGGRVLTARLKPGSVPLAYLNARSEQEFIVAPEDLDND